MSVRAKARDAFETPSRHRVLLLATAWLVSGSSLVAAPRALAVEPVSYAVHARIENAGAVVRGAMAIDVAVSEADREVRLWLYADRLAAVPRALDGRTARWIFPGEIDLGGVEVSDVRVDDRPVVMRRVSLRTDRVTGRDHGGQDLIVPLEPGPARRVLVRLRFVITLPERFGRLGRVGDVVSLLAPWYPLVVHDDGGWRARVPHRLRLQAEGLETWVGGVRAVGGTEVRLEGAYVPVLAAPRLHARTARAGQCMLNYISPRAPYDPPPPRSHGEAALRDLVRIDTVGLAARVLERVCATLRVASPDLVPGSLTLLAVASRTELAASAPGVVLVSDRIFEVLPLRETRAFHERALARAMFRVALQARLDALEPPWLRDVSEDVRAALLVDLDERRDRAGRTARSPEDLVGFAAFHPAIDQLLTAPTIAFVDAYFHAIEEPDPYRDDPARARRALARGRRVLEAARDVLGPNGFAALAARLIRVDGSLESALRAVDERAVPRLEAWATAPSRRVNYRLARVRSRRVAAGRWRHEALVERHGDATAEPVVVRFELEDGTRRRIVWDAEGPSAWLGVDAGAALRDVHVDPDGRLVQSAAVADGHPRGDDATRAPWKMPLLQSFNAAVASDGTFVGWADVAMRRRHDLDRALAAGVETGPASTGGTLRMIRGLGPRRDELSRVGFASAGVELTRLHAGFAGGSEGGWRVGLLGRAGIDTRRFLVDPRNGSSAGIAATAWLAHSDAGRWSPGLEVQGRASLVLPWGLRQATVLVGGGGLVLGASAAAERIRLGGRYTLRAVQPAEMVARAGLFGAIEHRWTALADLSVNAVHLSWLREVQLAAFLEGGVGHRVLRRHPAGNIDEQPWVPALGVGVGLRLHHEYAGVSPGVVALDVAVALVRGTRGPGADGVLAHRRPPVLLHLGFDQMF
ncbi:MAG: hypothetical protein NZ898_13920 [Myxococcota bacterium]|nr:hypothetical protein [Myxococcota bacterium]MDW8363696.1 hypothetical protein [Myxococcales bacterium]